MSRIPAVAQARGPSRARMLALVVAGGVVGTGLRSVIEDALSRPDSAFPWATFGVNVTGAALLGLLTQLTALRWRGPQGQRLRLALGTGLLGGYTTYSTFVIESIQLGSERDLVAALAYDAASLTLGFGAAFAVMAAVRARVPHRQDSSGGPSATGGVR